MTKSTLLRLAFIAEEGAYKKTYERYRAQRASEPGKPCTTEPIFLRLRLLSWGERAKSPGSLRQARDIPRIEGSNERRC
jgi:hypothetical protein